LHQGKKVKQLYSKGISDLNNQLYFNKKQDELEAYKSSGSNFYSKELNDIQPIIFV
jgi:hypothetical protein